MIGHNYMTINSYGLVIFVTSRKNGVIVNAIWDYVLHDYNMSSMAKIILKIYLWYILVIVLLPHGNLGWIQDFINHSWIDTW